MLYPESSSLSLHAAALVPLRAAAALRGLLRCQGPNVIVGALPRPAPVAAPPAGEGGRCGRPMRPRPRGPPACPPRCGSRARPTPPRAGRRRRGGSVRRRVRSQLPTDPPPTTRSAAWSDDKADTPPRCTQRRVGELNRAGAGSAPRAGARAAGGEHVADEPAAVRLRVLERAEGRVDDGPHLPVRPDRADVRVITGRRLQGGLGAVQVRGAGLVGHDLDGEVAPATGPVGAGLEAVQERRHALAEVRPAVGRAGRRRRTRRRSCSGRSRRRRVGPCSCRRRPPSARTL